MKERDRKPETERTRETDSEREKVKEKAKDRGRDRVDREEREEDRERPKEGERHRHRDREKERGWPRDREREKDRNRERDRDREKDRERDREKDKERERERDKEREREREEREKERERERERMKEREKDREAQREKERAERLKREEERRERELYERRKRELEEASRDDMTVLILNLDLKCTERDVYEFFSEHAGKVRDIQCIRDQRSGKSKGVAYAEFYTQEAVIKALACNGLMLKSQPIIVQASQAEKNRAAKAAKLQQAEVADGPMRVYVGGLVNMLSFINRDEVRELFKPFGEIVDVVIAKDPYTSRCRGYAFLQFKRAADAREAVIAMNGFEVAGVPIKVGMIAADQTINLGPNIEADGGSNGDQKLRVLQKQHSDLLAAAVAQQQLDDLERLDDDDGGGFLSGPTSRLALMQKLQRR